MAEDYKRQKERNEQEKQVGKFEMAQVVNELF